MSKKPLSISVQDDIKVKDELDTTRKWFNGPKKFRMVKLLPPYNREGLRD